MSEQTQPETALQSLAEKLRTDAIAIFGEGQAERDIIEWFYGALLAAAPATPAAQVAVPDVSAMAKVLSDRSADACNIDRTDNWAMYGQEYIEDVQAMLAAAPEHPAERQGGAAQSAPAGEREAFEAWWKLDAEGSENKAAAYEGWKARAAYAQGAPANEREGFRSWCESIGYPAALMTCGDLAAFQAGAAWQRTQAAGGAGCVCDGPRAF